MERIRPLTFLLLLVITGVILFPTVAAYTVTAENAVFGAAGESKSIDIVLDSAPQGIAGYKLTATVLDPETGQITGVTFPSWVSMSTKTPLPSDKVTLKGANLEKQAIMESTNIVLATLTVQSKKAGSTGFSFQVNELDSIGGGAIASPIPASPGSGIENHPSEIMTVGQEITSEITVRETNSPNLSVSIDPSVLEKATIAEQQIRDTAAEMASKNNNKPLAAAAQLSSDSPVNTPIPQQGLGAGIEVSVIITAIGGVVLLTRRK